MVGNDANLFGVLLIDIHLIVALVVRKPDLGDSLHRLCLRELDVLRDVAHGHVD